MQPGYALARQHARGLGRIVALVTDDFLDEMIAERASANPAFPALLDAAARRRQAETEQVVDNTHQDPK